MKKKLTLTIDEEIIKRAKIYAQESGRSLSELVENYLKKITIGNFVEEPQTSYQKETSKSKKYQIPEWLKGVAGSVDADVDYVRDRDKIREERYAKYL